MIQLLWVETLRDMIEFSGDFNRVIWTKNQTEANFSFQIHLIWLSISEADAIFHVDFNEFTHRIARLI